MISKNAIRGNLIGKPVLEAYELGAANALRIPAVRNPLPEKGDMAMNGNLLSYHNGTTWVDVENDTPTEVCWSLTGNTLADISFFGSLNNEPVHFISDSEIYGSLEPGHGFNFTKITVGDAPVSADNCIVMDNEDNRRKICLRLPAPTANYGYSGIGTETQTIRYNIYDYEEGKQVFSRSIDSGAYRTDLLTIHNNGAILCDNIGTFTPHKITTTQKDALTVGQYTNGSIFYNTTTNRLQLRQNNEWVNITYDDAPLNYLKTIVKGENTSSMKLSCVRILYSKTGGVTNTTMVNSKNITLLHIIYADYVRVDCNITEPYTTIFFHTTAVSNTDNDLFIYQIKLNSLTTSSFSVWMYNGDGVRSAVSSLNNGDYEFSISIWGE